MSDFDQIIAGELKIKRNGIYKIDPTVLADALKVVLEQYLNPLDEACELDLVIEIDLKEQEQ